MNSRKSVRTTYRLTGSLEQEEFLRFLSERSTGAGRAKLIKALTRLGLEAAIQHEKHESRD